MRRKLLVLWLVLVCGLALLSMCGSGRVGYQGGYSGQAVGQRVGYSGGGSAGWDTVSIILFTGPMVTVAAGVDTFAYPSGAGAVDQARIHNLNDIVLGRAERSWRADDGDTARLYRMGTGFEIPTFAYTEIDSGRYNAGPGAKDASGISTAIVSDRRDTPGGVAAINMDATWMTAADTARNRGFSHFQLVYAPFDSIIPANSTIVSATINVALNGNYYLASGDTVVATLMTNAGDNKWYKVFGNYDGNHPSIAKATWNAQRSASWGSVTTAHPWVPALARRAKMWDWGQICDWSGSTLTGGDYIPAYTNYPIEITNCVQAAVTGSTNNGIVISLHSASSSAYEKLGHYNWDRYNNANVAGRTPYIHIKYITKRYRPPFGTKEWAFLFATDDAKYQANVSYDSVMALHGGTYTLFTNQNNLGTPGYCTEAQLMGFYGNGREIGGHSAKHVNGVGLKRYHNTALNAGTGGNLAVGAATTGWDSLMLDTSPAWMYTMAAAQGYGDLTADRRFAKSFAFPNGPWSPEIVEALYRHGYTAIRGTGNGAAYDRTHYYEFAPVGAARSDTAWVDGPVTQSGRYARNMSLMAITVKASGAGQSLFGEKSDPADNEAELEEVRNNVRRLAYQMIGQNRRALVTFTHDEKNRPAFPAGYADGVNPDELEAALDVVDTFAGGGRYMGYAEYKDWIKSYATGISTPAFATAPDTFQVLASEKIWCVPDGIDNRWIPGVRDIARALSLDTTAPGAPSVYAYSAQDGQCLLFWTPPSGESPQAYSVYRFFDNAADTTLLAMVPSAQTYYVDTSAVNGSPHNYFVRARDASGNLSAPSSTSRLFPGTIRVIPRPAYWAFWYQDPADGAALAQADVNKLAEFDMIVGSPHSLEGPQLDEVAFDGLLGRIRAINPDFIYLTYYTAFCMYDYWADSPSQSVHKRVWEYAASLPDSSGFGRDADGDVVYGDFYPGQAYCNVMIPSLADTIAKILIETYEGSGTDGEWAGFFLDDSDTTLSEWMCNDLACGDLIDFDQDTTPYSSDDDEKAAFTEWHLRFVKAIRREFAERGMQNRLVVANTTFGRKEDPTADDTAYMGLLDGALNESWNNYWPGPNVPTDQDKWGLAFSWRNQLIHTQTSPPLMLWNARADSSQQYMNEVLAYAHGGFVNANNDVDWSSASAAPTMGRKKTALAPGLSAVVAYDEVDGGATADTLNIVTGDLTARMVLGQAYAGTYAVWPYAIYETGADLDDASSYLSRSKYWEIPEEAGAPAVTLQMNTQASVPGDRYNTIVWESNTALPSDFLGWFIYRDPCSGCDGNLYAEIPDVDPYGDGGLSWTYTDSSVTNGEEYTYLVAAVDANLNVSDSSDESDPLTPYDDTAPGVPTSLKAAGGAGYIDLDWLGVTAADLVGYEVSRADETGDGPGTFAVTDTVTISAHQDSTALESNFYYYRVRSLDDDGNRSAYTDAVIAAWYGDPDPPALPAPSNVMAWPDNPQGRTSVVMYAPADTTGLTGYQVFRGATADTGACVLYKTNVARGMFDGGVFEDLKANSDPDSTWYYTAKAMYGAARSEKFHTMRPALTTGGFPSLVPSVFAFGGGSNIGVAWVGVTGADSTLIYRGTTAGSQSWLATVAHGNNPYFDPTAAANTDYYYRVRLKDNPSTYTDYSAVFGPVRWTSTPSGDPSISTVTGTVSHGGTITIAGSSFGTNDVSGDFWDGLESGAFQSPWDVTQGGYSNGFSTVVSAGSNARHAGSNYVLKTSFPSTSGNAHQIIYRPPFTKLYAQYWVKLDNNFEFGGTGQSNSYGPTSLANVKFFRLWPYGSSNEDFVTAFHKYSATHSVTVEVENTEPYPHQWSAWGGFSNSDQFSKNTWHLLQFEYKSSSGQGVADGFFKMTFDGSVKFSRSDIVTMQDGVAEKDEIYLGFGDTTGGWNYDGANDVYFDDFYIAPTLARVEIGNASTYAACTHREIQIPSAWSATSITCTVNTGSFSSGAAYLFVIDEDGTVSAGKPITVE